MAALLWAVGEMGGASPAEGRFLNLGGLLSVHYGRSITLSDSGNSAVHSSGLNASLAASGDAYNLGSYSMDISSGNQSTTVETTEQNSRFHVTDYRLALNLFPQWSPLSITRTRTIRQNDLELASLRVTSKDRIDALAAHWVLNVRRLPRTVLNYHQSLLQPDAGGNTLNRALSAYSDSTIGVTHIDIGYQYSTFKQAESGTSRSHGLNLDTISQLTTSLTLTAYGRYSSSVFPETTVSPGVPVVNSFQERSAGTGLFYRPPNYWWDGSISYGYSENPFFNDFRSHSVQSAANLRYNEKTDSGLGARYQHLSVTDSTVDSESADASLNYRPIFGLTTGLSGSGGLTSTHLTGTADTDSIFQHYQYNINYTRPWQLIQYRASYNISYGISDTQPTGFGSRDLTNGVSMGVDNTNTEIIHVGLNTSYSDIQRVTESTRSDQSSYVIQLSADSNYFRNLILIGDSLALRAGASYSDTTGFGVEGRVVSGEWAANYNTLIGVDAGVNYHVDDYPTELLLDRQIISGQIRYSTVLIGGIRTAMSVRDSVEDNRYRSDVNSLEGSVSMNYQVGRLSLGAQYQELETRSAGNRFGSRSIMGRASRSF